MVEVGVDPAADQRLISRSRSPCQARRGGPAEGDDGSAIVAVQMLAFAVIIQQAMAVAEADFARHLEHFAGLAADGQGSQRVEEHSTGLSLKSWQLLCASLCPLWR